MFKKLLAFFVILMALFSFKKSFAQYPGMAAVRANMNQQIMNQQMRTLTQMTMMSGRPLPNREYPYLVTLKDSSTKIVKSRIYTDTILHKSYLLLVDKKIPKSDTAHRKQRIYPEQTLYICRIDGNNSGTALQKDSCWMFPAMIGAIKIYSYLSEPANDPAFDVSSIVALQLDNGAIMKFNAENLKKMIDTNADALKYFEKKNYYKAIKKYNVDRGKTNSH